MTSVRTIPTVATVAMIFASLLIAIAAACVIAATFYKTDSAPDTELKAMLAEIKSSIASQGTASKPSDQELTNIARSPNSSANEKVVAGILANILKRLEGAEAEQKKIQDATGLNSRQIQDLQWALDTSGKLQRFDDKPVLGADF